MKRERPSEEATLAAWGDLLDAICRVETALPHQMSAAITRLTRERKRFDDLLMGRTALEHRT
jgi:hypothetical protein